MPIVDPLETFNKQKPQTNFLALNKFGRKIFNEFLNVCTTFRCCFCSLFSVEFYVNFQLHGNEGFIILVPSHVWRSWNSRLISDGIATSLILNANEILQISWAGKIFLTKIQARLCKCVEHNLGTTRGEWNFVMQINLNLHGR